MCFQPCAAATYLPAGPFVQWSTVVEGLPQTALRLGYFREVVGPPEPMNRQMAGQRFHLGGRVVKYRRRQSVTPESARTLPMVETPASEAIGRDVAYPLRATFLLTGRRRAEILGLRRRRR
jgi:hypothetical protein